jgi:hypothetical protein
MRFTALALCVLLSLCLSGCITAYHSNKTQVASCQDFDAQKWVRKELGERHLPEMNAEAVRRYMDPVPVNDEKALLKPVIIRYSEAGNIANQCDIALALQAIREVKKDKIVLVFVHGWRNDSGPEGEFLYNYLPAAVPSGVMGDDLKTFASLAAAVSRNARKPVVPIFVSWKGGPGLGPLDFISFWDRRDAADRIARTGELNLLFGAIEKIKYDQKKGGVDDHVIYMGHSFGSRILFSSVVSEMISRAQLAAPDIGGPDAGRFAPIQAPADLVLLFNPALEAASYRAVDEFRYSSAPYNENNNVPLMMVMQSESDKAVGVYFPLGQFFGGFLNTTRITGLGFKPEFRTHVMCPKQEGKGCGDLAADNQFLCPTGACTNSPYTFASAPWPGAHDSPFDVVIVKEEILDGHVWFNGHRGIETMFNNDNQDGEAFNKWLGRLLAGVTDVR